MRLRYRLPTFKQPSLLIGTLLSMGLLDEIVAGFPVVGLPLLRDHFHLSYTQAGLLFTIGAFSGLVFDPIINLLSDRSSKRLWILSGLLLFAASYIFAGLASNYALLLLAFILIAPVSEVAVGLSQAALVDFHPERSSWVMARWTLLSSFGDILSPFLIAGIATLHFGWTTLCLLAATLWLGPGIIVALHPFPHVNVHDEEDNKDNAQASPTGFLVELQTALRDPSLLRWSVLTVIPTMVDEMFLGFVALYLHDVLHTDQEEIGLIIGIHMLGAMLGLLALDRFLLHRFSARHLLTWFSLIALGAMIVFLTIHILWVSIAAIFVIGLAAANWYPLAKGEAYNTLPGRSGTVRAVISLFNVVDVALPAVIGIIAGKFGILVGVSVLGMAPLLMLTLLAVYHHSASPVSQ